MKRLSKIKIEWSPHFAYAIGLITTDGCLSKDGRHLDFTSKEKELINLFKDCLKIVNKIGRKCRGTDRTKKYFRVQFGDKNFYNFLLEIGLSPAKSKSIGPLKIPKSYFLDFFRGCIDGDGSIHIFNHPESQYRQLQIRLFSASLDFLKWIDRELKSIVTVVEGGWIKKEPGIYTLSYGKSDSIKIIKNLYADHKSPRLKRKYLLANSFMRV